MISMKAIYVMWLREMKILMRSKSRIIGTIIIPLLFLVFIGFGFSAIKIPGQFADVDYIQFLVPGIIGMGILFRSIFFGVSVIWDKQFGFLKEIMIAPVSRLSLMLGRTAGGVSAVLIQGIFILFVSLFLGFTIPGVVPLLLSLVFMVFISVTFISLGLIFATKMKDMEGFSLIMNFVTFPLFFLSGALYPIESLPEFIRFVSYIDPLTYGIDGMRGLLIGTSTFPIITDLAAIAGFSIFMLFLGAWLFEKSEAV